MLLFFTDSPLEDMATKANGYIEEAGKMKKEGKEKVVSGIA